MQVLDLYLGWREEADVLLLYIRRKGGLVWFGFLFNTLHFPLVSDFALSPLISYLVSHTVSVVNLISDIKVALSKRIFSKRDDPIWFQHYSVIILTDSI